MSTRPSSTRKIGLRALLAVFVVVAAAVYLQLQPLAAKSSTCMLTDDLSTSAMEDRAAEILSDGNSNVDSQPIASVELGRLQALEQRCTSLKKDFDRIQPHDIESIASSVALLQELRKFDSQYTDVMTRFDLAVQSQNSLADDPHRNVSQSRVKRVVEMGKSRRVLVRICFLQLVTKARQNAVAMTHEENNWNGAFGCEVGMLSRVEQHAVSGAEAEEENSGVLSSLGAYWSELAISGRSAAPLFGFGYDSSGKVLTKWMLNSWDSQPTAEMTKAELLLFRSVETSSVKLPSLNFVLAQRLIAHADFLEAKAYHGAAVERYRKAADLAEKNSNAPLAAQAFAKLSFSLKQYGSTEEALGVAAKAIELTKDPLAQFVWASIHMTSGVLQSKEELKQLGDQLKAVAGQLPPELEAQRQQMRVEIMMWSWVSQGDMTKCTGIKDPARFLICIICKLIF